ncbi:MAG: hypothetical protein GY863_01630 [bacterium]|nr:hypothetical protein [bacterium]
MKKIITIFLVISIAFALSGTAHRKSLVDIYRSGTLKIEADPEFGKNTDWDTLFSDYYKLSSNNKQIGKIKSLAVSGDGSIFVSNYSSYSIYKFDNTGNFVKEFGREGSKTGDFLMRPTLACALEQEYIITREGNGRLNFFGLEGNFGKLVKVDYMTRGIIPISDSVIAIAGWVLYSGNRSRYIVSLKNLDTLEETIVHSEFRERGTRIVSENPFVAVPAQYVRTEFVLSKISDDRFVVGSSDNQELVIFNSNGREIKRIGHNIIPRKITQKEREEYRENSINSLEEVRIHFKDEGKSDEGIDKAIKILDDPDFYPESMPYYYNLMSDSEGNILIFAYTDEEELHKFRVYSPDGEFICETQIDPGDYNLNINYRLNNMIFHNGSLYCIAELKESEGIPLRLIKVNLQ